MSVATSNSFNEKERVEDNSDLCESKIKLENAKAGEGGSNLLQPCKHFIVRERYGKKCGEVMDEDDGRALFYLQKGLRLSNDAINRVRKARSEKTFKQRKLHLVLDLDHTLIHSLQFGHLTWEEKYLLKEIDSRDDLGRRNFRLTKLRPSVRSFLREANSMFEMYIYTKSTSEQAMSAASLLDPENKYFRNRVITRRESPETTKTLDLVLAQKHGIVIVDDSEGAWPNHQKNLIQIAEYNYFAGGGKSWYDMLKKSHAEKKTDESETDGALTDVLRILKGIHGRFFDEKSNPGRRDVRLIIASMRAAILKDCTIYFTQKIVKQTDKLSYGKILKELGALCTSDSRDSSITHVVATDTEEEDCQWASKQNKFLVNPRWLEAAYYSWRRPPEERYSVGWSTDDEGK